MAKKTNKKRIYSADRKRRLAKQNEVQKSSVTEESSAVIEKKKTETAVHVKVKEKKQISLPSWAIMSLFIFFDECILKLFVRGSWFPAIFFIAGWSLFFGSIAGILTSFAKKEAVNRWARIILLTVIAVIFAINYFVFKQFKIFYDLTTMTAGATDALGQFQSNVVELLTSSDGIGILACLFVPIILYIVFRKKMDDGKQMSWKNKGFTVCLTVISMLVTYFGMNLVPNFHAAYDEEYSYQKAIADFGLLTGIRLDLNKYLFQKEEVSFTEAEPTATPEATPEPTPIVYDTETMNIDFDSKIANANDQRLVTMDQWVSSRTPSHENEYTGMFTGKNLIMITAEAFSAEVIDETLTPALYRLATKGINFTDYYQPASACTTGGEYEILFANLPTNGGSSLKKMGNRNNYMTMGSQLNRLGYNGWAFHANSYTFYDRHITHNNLGYSNGFMGYGNGMENYVTNQWPQSDLEMISNTYSLYSNAEPYNVYYMSVSGHNGYDVGGNAMTKKNWDRVADLPYSDAVKGYLAANLELEDGLTDLLAKLEESGQINDTVIVISADHFPYGLDSGGDVGNLPYLSELYGYNVTNYMERDHNRLIIWSGSLEAEEPIIVDSPTSSLDIVPTLSNLFGLDWDSRLFVGRDVFSDASPLVFNSIYDWKTDLGTYYAYSGSFVPASEDIVIPEGYVESIRNEVKNRMTYCQAFNNTDYYAHLFN